MVSKNKLLGSGKTDVEEVKEVLVSIPESNFPILMHSVNEKYKVVKTKAEMQKLYDEGWRDHPGKVRLLPAFEHLFEGVKENTSINAFDQFVKDTESVVKN